MEGLKGMVQVKGGLPSIEKYLQLEIHRYVA